MSEHTMSNRIARSFIHNPRNLLAVVGYSDPQSPLARILNSQRGEEVELDARHDPVRRNCETERFDFSGDELADAHEIVIKTADMVTSAKGGAGAVREVCELMLKTHHRWKAVLEEIL